MIFVLKVTTNKEEQVFEMLSEREASRKNLSSITKPHGLRGYLIVEALDKEQAQKATANLPYVKGVIPREVIYEEIKNMLEPISAEIKIEKGDIVEIIAEPFKKEKAKVIRVDKGKEEVVIELLESAVPIPITVKLDNVRVIRREEEK